MTKAEALHHAKVLDYMHSEAYGMGDSNPIGKTAMESIVAAVQFLRDAVEAEPDLFVNNDTGRVTRNLREAQAWERGGLSVDVFYTSQLED